MDLPNPSSNTNTMNELPESTIYHILSNLPEDGTVTRELARFSLVSKEWRRACSFYHVVDFIGTCSYDTLKDVQKTEKFIKFIDKTMTNCQYIRKLRLHIDFNVFSDRPQTTLPDDSPTKALPPLFDKWIHIALDKRVQEIDLRIRVRCISRKVQENTGIEEYDARYKDDESSNWRYHIPIRVLSSDFVKSLSLGWQVCLPRSLVDDMNMELELPVTSLKSLQLFRLTKINTKAAVRLIGACPFLEELIIDSEYIDRIKVSGLHRLKMLSIRRCLRSNAGSSRINTSFQINIEAPSLETLCLLDLGRVAVGYGERVVYRTIFHLDCYNLKCLKLIRDGSMDDTKLAAFVSQFPTLESLELDHCRLIKEINIINPMMKKMEFKFGNLWGFRHVEISSPNVLHLRYESTSGKRFPSIGVSENNWPRYVEAVFRNTHQPISLFSYWFRNLRESLMRLRFSRISLSFHYMWKKESGEEKDLVPTRLPACKIDKLNLSVTGPCASFPVILSRLFSTFHATTLQASLIEDNSGQGHAFLRFLCENLLHRGNDNLCSTCFVDYKCWKHQLKEVKLEGIKGLDGKRSLNWVEMFKLLPTLTVDHRICFSLQWAT